MKINAFDIDGVITVGIFPGPKDILITGRSIEESEETYRYLHSLKIYNAVYFNPVEFQEKTRINSGWHKANIINLFNGDIETMFEDDEIQLNETKNRVVFKTNFVYISHTLTNKENEKHPFIEK